MRKARPEPARESTCLAEFGKEKHWFFVHYLPGHASHLRAKELRAGDQVRLIVEAGRNGRGLIKDVIPVLPTK